MSKISLTKEKKLPKDEDDSIDKFLAAQSFFKRFSGKFNHKDLDEKIKSKIDPTSKDYDPRLHYLLDKHMI